LRAAARVLGLDGDADVAVVRDAALPDGFGAAWSPADVVRHVQAEVARCDADVVRAGDDGPTPREFARARCPSLHPAAPPPSQVITFDEGGVSGHPNHIAVCRGVRQLVASRRLPAHVAAYELDTVSLPRKFTGALDVLLTVASVAARTALRGAGEPPPIVLTSLGQPLLSHAAMAAHGSQYVWFRRLFVPFSRYTYVNSLTPMQRRPMP
jgi:LmbE family N-acetylglucosaminyl deacetylase